MSTYDLQWNKLKNDSYITLQVNDTRSVQFSAAGCCINLVASPIENDII